MLANCLREGRDEEANEMNLFHGTGNLDTVRGICTNSFDFRMSGKHGTKYGDGTYFAKRAKYSHSYTKAPRMMFRARVLVGGYVEGESSLRRPPVRPGRAHDLYDSCVDSMQEPSIFVIFEKTQSYPEYLIKYEAPELEATIPALTQAHYGISNPRTQSAYGSGSHSYSGRQLTSNVSYQSTSTVPITVTTASTSSDQFSTDDVQTSNYRTQRSVSPSPPPRPTQLNYPYSTVPASSNIRTHKEEQSCVLQ